MRCRCRCGEEVLTGRAYIPGHWIQSVIEGASVRFWKRVQKGTPEDCWLWLGHTDRGGYGQFALGKRTITAHRMAYWLTHGVWSSRAHPLMHSCDNPPCVNPAHLSLGTTLQNNRDAGIRRRKARGGEHWTHRMPERVARGRQPGREYDELRGTNHWNVKLTENDVREIRALYATGKYTYAALARIYPVNAEMISFIVRRLFWKHVE